MPLPPSLAAKRGELDRVERLRSHADGSRASRVLAIERRRLVIAIDRQETDEGSRQ